jgi:hypothetical protein
MAGDLCFAHFSVKLCDDDKVILVISSQTVVNKTAHRQAEMSCTSCIDAFKTPLEYCEFQEQAKFISEFWYVF